VYGRSQDQIHRQERRAAIPAEWGDLDHSPILRVARE
jgi:hypothetical protein